MVPTGGGKTAYFVMYILMLLALSRSPELQHMVVRAPKDPCLVMVYPTCGLEEEQVRQHSLTHVQVG